MEKRKVRAYNRYRCFLGVLALLASMKCMPVYAQSSEIMSEMCQARTIPSSATSATTFSAATSAAYLRVENYIVAGYRIKSAVARQIIDAACHAGVRQKIDPLLVLAVVSVETSFNPAARSKGESRGLMQVVASAHPEKVQKFGGATALDNIHANVLIGAWVLKEYLRRDGGVVPALQRYNGSRFDKHRRYSKKVMNAYQNLCAASQGKNCQGAASVDNISMSYTRNSTQALLATAYRCRSDRA